MKLIKHAALCLPLLLSACNYSAPHPISDNERVNHVLTRAAWDFQCQSSDLTLVRSNNYTFDVSGCDKEATYVLRNCDTTSLTGSKCKAVLDSEIKVNTVRGYP